MRILAFQILLMIVTIRAFGQSSDSISYWMNIAENLEWVSKLQAFNKSEQLNSIQQRFFHTSTAREKGTDEDAPVLILDGIPIADTIDDELRDFLAYGLSAAAVEINILDEEPAGFYVNKRWSGIILINVTDKKTRKKLKKLR